MRKDSNLSSIKALLQKILAVKRSYGKNHISLRPFGLARSIALFFGAGCAALLSLILSTISLFKEKCRIWSGAMVIISLGILITLLVWFNS